MGPGKATPACATLGLVDAPLSHHDLRYCGEEDSA